MNRQELLDAAGKLISGDRAKDYGDAYDNHGRIAEGWNIILRGALNDPDGLFGFFDIFTGDRVLTTQERKDSFHK